MILLHTANASLFVNTEKEIIVENTLLTKYIANGNAETHICLRRKKKWNYGLEYLQKLQKNCTNKSEMSHKFRPRTLEAKGRKVDTTSN